MSKESSGYVALICLSGPLPATWMHQSQDQGGKESLQSTNGERLFIASGIGQFKMKINFEGRGDLICVLPFHPVVGLWFDGKSQTLHKNSISIALKATSINVLVTKGPSQKFNVANNRKFIVKWLVHTYFFCQKLSWIWFWQCWTWTVRLQLGHSTEIA